jgi:glutamate N-acetyltransferase/amino-acid N-acetyltransferase
MRVAKTIANSPLVKTAVHGADPNWGRIVAAAGRSGVLFDVDRAYGARGRRPAVREWPAARRQRAQGGRTPEAEGLWRSTFDLGTGGGGDATVWTCDLTPST